MGDAAFIYSESLSGFDYGDDHPFKPIRAKNTMELCNRHGLLYAHGVVRLEPSPATKEDLLLFHSEEYIQTLQRANDGSHDLDMLAAGIGTPDNPPLMGVYDFSLEAVGASLTGAKALVEKKATRAFNLVGGLHHAGRNHAEGFCYVNDIGVVIEYLLKKGFRRIAYVDLDAHHGNGVQVPYYNDPRVLTISLHEFEQGFYPEMGRADEIGEGEGKGYCVNVPLVKKTDDEVYRYAFDEIVPPVLEAYKPEIIIAQVGADVIISDPLTHLRLTSNEYEENVKKLCKFDAPILALGGGGYDIFRTARCWTLAWGALCDIEPEDEYAGLVGGRMFGTEIGGLHDMPMLTKGEEKEIAVSAAKAAVAKLKKTIFPILGV